jgi:uncharacterized protein GlcG (DUF336 family)
MHVTIADAEGAIEAARKRALELGTEMCIAIVDSGANLKAFHRMDDAWVGSIVPSPLGKPAIHVIMSTLLAACIAAPPAHVRHGCSGKSLTPIGPTPASATA